jgi:pimeloyl-ACP methyl ester carboxylesterase
MANPSTEAGPWQAFPFPGAASEYLLDAWQRTILTMDVLRERGNQTLESIRLGKPPVLIFDYEMVLDGRPLRRPANYALVRIKPGADDPPTDPRRRPFVVIDPRAGQGPGIGGFKLDSDVGIAVKQGHPCYCVTFFPQPLPGQTIEAVCAAEIAFLRKVNELHPDAQGRPFLIGNCQGGWALAMLASLTPEESGPILLAGSPISYWAGVVGKNPMRYAGGMLGGSWMASFASDLGNGKFDGAYLVNNFDLLNPANTFWTKLYNLYSNVDTERERFLQFEKWWSSPFFMNRAEMDWIVQNLFVGNKLSAGAIESFDGQHRVDLRNIRSPIIVFASWGDNITPPQQALNWIPDLYASVDDIRLNEQTIVYCLHAKVGHLGIFVSGAVARKHTNELVSALELIDTLPPGLYEATIQDTHPDMPGIEHVAGRYLIQFVPRRIDDVLALDDGRDDERAFEVVRRVAEINQGLYDTFVSPWVKAMSNDLTAWALWLTNPVRVSQLMFCDLNPAMMWVKALANMVRADRHPVAADNPYLKRESEVSQQIVEALDRFRDLRDGLQEQLFKAIYESSWLPRAVGVRPATPGRQAAESATWEREELARLKRKEIEGLVESGTLVDAWARILLYLRPDGPADERPFNMVRRMIEELKPENIPSMAALQAALKRQALVMALDEERAIAALPKLAPQRDVAQRGLDAAQAILSARGALTDRQNERLRRVAEIFGFNGVPANGAHVQ